MGTSGLTALGGKEASPQSAPVRSERGERGEKGERKKKAEKNGTSAVANMPMAWKTVGFGGTGTPHRSDWFLHVSIRSGGTGTPLRNMLTCRLEWREKEDLQCQG